MMKRMGWMVVVLGMCGIPWAWAATYYVDGKNPAANDANAGTLEAPFKTLSRAGEAARAGDQVFIRGGLYRETFRILSPNRYPTNEPARIPRVRGWHEGAGPDPDRIVFEAFQDEAVIVDGSEPLPRELWRPVEGRPGLFAIALAQALKAPLQAARIEPAKFEPGYVFWNDARIQPYRVRDEQGLWQPALPEAAGAPAWHYDASNQVLYAHLGGKDPRVEGTMELAVRNIGVEATGTRKVTLRKLWVRRVAGWGIETGASEDNIIEDCRVTQARSTGIRAGTSEPVTVRRCRVDDVDGRGIDTTCSHQARIYDNVVADFSKAGWGYFDYAYIVFGGKFNEFYNNFALRPRETERVTGGYWTDCAGVGHLWIGNAAINCGFYIESPSVNNLVQWNTVWRMPNQALYLRANYANMVRENLVAHSGTALAISSTETPQPIVSGNVFLQNWLKQNRSGIHIGGEYGCITEQRLNFAQANIYEMAADGIVGGWAGRSYRTLEEFRAGTAQESLGREAEIDYGELGLVWVRADYPGGSHEPFPVFGNPAFKRQGTQLGAEPYFWRRGDALGSDGFPNEWAPAHRFHTPIFAGQGFAGEYARPEAWNQQLGWSRWPTVAAVPNSPVGGMVFHVGSFPNKSLDARGVGCWSPTLPTVGGAEIDVALWMRITNVTASAPDGGAVAYVEWSDWTGQNKSRSYLVGGADDQKLVHPEFARGTRDWGRVAGRVKAPDHARRFALYLGMRNASGEAMYGAVEKIETLPGKAPPVAKRKADNPPLVNPAKLTFKPLDLSGVVNRPLQDEQADDGQGGWTDQGPGFDMRGLLTGRQEHEGVPYEILAPKSCVVLRAPQRPQSADLPEAVTIPVKAKARTLYFLHTGAWIGDGVRHWTYHIRYADGQTEAIPVIGGVNVRDWGQAGESYDFPRTARRRTTVWPQKIGNMLSPTCGLYVMEWLNPRPDVPIAEIVMTVEPPEKRTGVPILLAITLGMDK